MGPPLSFRPMRGFVGKFKPILRKMVEVEWEDTASINGWKSLLAYKDSGPEVCRSVGYVATSNKNKLTLLQSQFADGQVADSISIPRSRVKRVRVLKSRL